MSNFIHRNKAFALFVITLISTCVSGKLINLKLSSSLAQKRGGQVLTSFTFTSGGNGVFLYKLSSAWKVLPKIYIFPYDTELPLPMVTEKINSENCHHFFQKAMQLMELRNLTGRVTLGKFSGPFPVTLVYADQFTCADRHEDSVVAVNKQNDDLGDLKEPRDAKSAALKPVPQVAPRKNEDLSCQVQLLNTDRLGNATEHLSAEETGLLGFFEIVCLSYFIVACISVPRLWSPLSKPGPMQTVLRLVSVVAGLQFLASLLFFSHLYKYSHSGVGYRWCEIVAELVDLACHYLLLLLIVSWTLAGREHSRFTWAHSTGKFIGVLASIQLVYFLWTEVVAPPTGPMWDKDQQTFRNGLGLGSQSLSLPTALLFALRLAIASIFAGHLLKVAKRERSPIKRDFFETFALISLLWFLSYPVMYFIGLICTDYLRYKFVTICVSVCQAGAIFLYFKLFLSRSLFWEISTLSGTLPIVLKFDKTYGLKASP